MRLMLRFVQEGVVILIQTQAMRGALRVGDISTDLGHELVMLIQTQADSGHERGVSTDLGHELVMLIQTQAMRGALRRVGRRISYTVTFYTLILKLGRVMF